MREGGRGRKRGKRRNLIKRSLLMLLIWKYCRRKRLTHTYTHTHTGTHLQSISSGGQIQKIRRYKIVEKRHKKQQQQSAQPSQSQSTPLIFMGARIHRLCARWQTSRRDLGERQSNQVYKQVVILNSRNNEKLPNPIGKTQTLTHTHSCTDNKFVA